MRKIAKLSLVAAIAVAGLTNVNAASLEESIKGVDVSGQFRFRTEDKSSTNNYTDVEVEVGVKVPVTENVTAVFKIDTTRNTDDTAAQSSDKLDIEDYYLSYSNGDLTVNAGQQNIPGRITDGAQGDGIVALYNLGAVTVGGAAFMDNSLTQAHDVYSVIAMGSAGPVSFTAQYADVIDYTKTYNIKADAKFGPATVGAEYTDSDDEISSDRNTLKVYASAKMGIVSGTVAYAETGKDGSGSIAEEAEAESEFLIWQLGSFGKEDMTAYAIDASVAVTDQISLRAAYADGEVGTTDVSETLGQVSYKVAKNLNTYVRYSKLETEGADDVNRGRVEFRYSF